MYNIIKNPETNRNVSIYSKKGIAILEKYLNNLKGGIKLNLLKDTIPDDFRDGTYIELLNNIFKIIKDSKSNKNKNEVDLQILLKNIEDAPSSKISSVTIEYLYRNMLYFFISAQDKDNKFIENLYETDLQEKINLFKKNYKFLKKIDINRLKKIDLYKDNEGGGGVKNDSDGYTFRIYLTNIMSVLLILIKNLSDLKLSRPSALSNLKIEELTKKVTDNINKLLVSKELNGLNGQRGIVCTINSAKLIIDINIFLKDLFKKQENIFIFNDLFKDLPESILNNNIK